MERFANHTMMTKFLAVVLLGTSVLGLASAVLSLMHPQHQPGVRVSIILTAAFSVVGLGAGVALLMRSTYSFGFAALFSVYFVINVIPGVIPDALVAQARQPELLKYPEAKRCSECHQAIFDAWNKSRHSVAWVSEGYVKASENHSKEKCLKEVQDWALSRKRSANSGKRTPKKVLKTQNTQKLKKMAKSIKKITVK